MPTARGDQRGGAAEQRCSIRKARVDRAACRAEHLQHDRIVDPAAMPGGDCAAEDQHAGSQRHQRDRAAAHCRSSPTTRDTAASASRTWIADMFGKAVGDRAHHFLRLGRRGIDGGEMGLRRVFECAGREHDREVDAEPLPVDRRRLAIVAVISRPSRLTVRVSPTLSPMPGASAASNETSGGPW